MNQVDLIKDENLDDQALMICCNESFLLNFKTIFVD